MSKRVEVSRTIKAPAELLYDMLSDLPRMGEWSPENRGGRWVNGATGPAVGARFKGRNRKGWARWSTDATVVTAVPGPAAHPRVSRADVRAQFTRVVVGDSAGRVGLGWRLAGGG
jgi:hypothetical protein